LSVFKLVGSYFTICFNKIINLVKTLQNLPWTLWLLARKPPGSKNVYCESLRSMKVGCGAGARVGAQAILDDWSWSRSWN